MTQDSRPPTPASASATHGHGADFVTRTSLLALGVPTDAPWVRLRSDTLVAARQTALVTVDGAVRQSFPWAPDPEQRDAWNGFALEVFGVLHAGTPDPRFAPLVGVYGPWWPLADTDGSLLYVRIWQYRVLLSGTPLSVQLTIGHGTGQRRRGSIEGLELEHKPADTLRAARAEALLWRLEKTAGGRPRKLTPAQEAELAAEARRLAREQPGRSRLDIAFDLGLIVVDEDDEMAVGPKAVKRAEQTALRRLHRILTNQPEL